MTIVVFLYGKWTEPWPKRSPIFRRRAIASICFALRRQQGNLRCKRNPCPSTQTQTYPIVSIASIGFMLASFGSLGQQRPALNLP